MEFCTSDCTPTPEMSFRLSKDVRAQRQSSSTPQSQSFFASVNIFYFIKK